MRRLFERRFGYSRLICVALLVGFAALRLIDPAPIEELRLRTFDAFQVIDPRIKTARPVTIVDIDEKSLAKRGQWPWPRTVIADMIINLTNLGAVAIAFDTIFAEPDRLNPHIVAGQMRYLDEVTRSKLRELPSNDEIMADAIRRSRVVVGETGLATALSELDKSLPLTGFATLGEDPEPFLLSFRACCGTCRRSRRRPPGAACSRSSPSATASCAACRWFCRTQGVTMPSLTLEILRSPPAPQRSSSRPTRPESRASASGALEIPTDSNGQLWVHFAPHDPSIYISASDVLDGNVPLEQAPGKLVLIGTSAVGLLDIKTTPVSPVDARASRSMRRCWRAC